MIAHASGLTRPTYSSGFYAPVAPYLSRPMFPNLWRECVGAWCPGLGVTHALPDWSGYGKSGTRQGATGSNNLPQFVVRDSAGYALDNDGTDDAVDCGTGTNLDLTRWTISIWVRPRTHTTGKLESIVTKGQATNSDLNYILAMSHVTNRALRFGFEGSTDNFFDGATLLTLDEWSHACVTYGSGILRLWVNGKLDNSQTINQTPVLYNALSLRIGLVNAGPVSVWDAFDGFWDDCRLWSRALNENEIWLLAGGGGNQSVGRGISYRMVDDAPFAEVVAAAGGGFPFQHYYGGAF